MNFKSRKSLVAEVQHLKKENAALKKELEISNLCGYPTEADRNLYDYPLKQMRNLWTWLPEFANTAETTVLEIGSREVVNKSRLREALPKAKHIGFDIYEGPNVDLVGDAHRLSEYVPKNSIDLIVSFAVFEHLAMPWVVAEEYARVLKTGGIACTMTHFSYSEHEMPWHFFQFNNMGLEALFNGSLGFETIESGKGMPMVGRFAYDCADDRAGQPIGRLYCTSYIYSKKIKNMPERYSWTDALASVYRNTQYPKN